MTEPLRIGVISPVWFPVPPTGYGGIEWIVWLLADGLVDAGHDVTLFASGDSHTKAKLSSVLPTAPSARIGQSLPELQHCLACYGSADEFDVINDHSGLPAAVIGGLIAKPVLLLQVLLGLQPDRERQTLETLAPRQLPSWAGAIRLSGIRVFGRSFDVHVTDGKVRVEQS